MSSVRGLVLVIFALVVSTVAQANEPHTNRASEERNASDSIHARLLSLFNLPIPFNENVQSTEYEKPCAEGEDNRQSDLCAQWKAASAASEAAFWTLMSVIFGGVGTAGLFITLYFNWKAFRLAMKASNEADRALIIAERSADAAHRTVETTENIGRHQIRAYLSCNSGELISNKNSIQCFPRIKNDGQSPAFNVVIEAEINTGLDRRISNGTNSPRYSTIGNIGVIASGNSVDGILVWSKLNESEIETIFVAETPFCLTGAVRWTDVFKDVHRMTFMIISTDERQNRSLGLGVGIIDGMREPMSGHTEKVHLNQDRED